MLHNGGVVFGPTPRSYKFKLNRKVRRLALKSALSSKVQDNEFTAIDGISFEAPKTKQMVKVLENLNAPVKTLIVVDEITLNVEKSASNIPGVKLLDAKHVNVYDILNSDKLIMTEAAMTDVLKKPVLTEKSLALQTEENKYTFDVDLDANKTEVKIAVEKLFNVKVEKVNIMNVKPKAKRMGRYEGKTNKRRKAIVKLAEGNSINYFDED